jgi:ABC-type transport system involved in multi-copper enzyme maturation permease subunit
VVLTLSLAVSVVFRNPGTTIVALLLIWGVLIVAVPALSTPLAYLIVDPPHTQQTLIDIRREWVTPERIQRLRAAEEQVREELFGDRPRNELTREEQWQLDGALSGVYHDNRADMVERVAGHVATLTRYERNVDRLMRWIARISPYGCLRNACVALAGTDTEHDLELRTSTVNFMTSMYRFWRECVDNGEYWRFPAQRGPRYRFVPRTFGASLLRALPDLAALLLMGGVALLIAFVAFLRSEVA